MNVCEYNHFYLGAECDLCAAHRNPIHVVAGGTRRTTRAVATARRRPRSLMTNDEVRVRDVPNVSERAASPIAGAWIVKLIIVGLLGWWILRSLVPLVAPWLLPLFLVWMVARRITGSGGGRTWPWVVGGMALGRGLFGPPRNAPARAFYVTTFLGDANGRTRRYELVTGVTPLIEHGEQVRIVGIGSGGTKRVWAIRTQSGWLVRRGLMATTATVFAIAVVGVWWLLR